MVDKERNQGLTIDRVVELSGSPYGAPDWGNDLTLDCRAASAWVIHVRTKPRGEVRHSASHLFLFLHFHHLTVFF
jgi:hypothetical protein